MKDVPTVSELGERQTFGTETAIKPIESQAQS
jgi:hypothetical protein